MTMVIGPSRDRVDGRLKVTGAAKYAVEFELPDCGHAWTVESNIAKGKILEIDDSDAQLAPGVLAILTHLNTPKFNPIPRNERMVGTRIEERFPLNDDQVHYAGQYVAMAVAETLEEARHAASLIRVSYAPEKPLLTMDAAQHNAEKPEKNRSERVQINKGDVEATLRESNLVKIEETYSTPTLTHNPIEMSGTIARWEGEQKLRLYDSTQFVKGVQNLVALAFGLEVENVRVICPFVGGAFGCKGALWMHILLAAAAAKMVARPVKLHVTRRNMFVGTGHRTPTRQKLSLAARPDGKLQAIHHVTTTLTSTVGQFTEACGARSSAVMYESPAIRVEETLYPVNYSTPTFMRAPGYCPGTYALECAMDELSYELKMDPVALRLINHSDNHPTKNAPFSAKYLRDAYRTGAERFGWSKRNSQPRSMRQGDLLIGWGMATATYPAHKRNAAARIKLRADGTATVQCATHELGTGAYTAFTQIASEQIGVPFENITFDLGDSDFPFGPVAGGSNSTASVGIAIHEAALLLHKALAEIAVKDSRSPLYNLNVNDVTMVAPGRIGLKTEDGKSDGYGDILKRTSKDIIEVQSEETQPQENEKQAFQSWGAHFCEVGVDPLLPRVQVRRVVSVMNCGRIVSGKTARSQIIGGVVMAIGMALTEETAYDQTTGLPVIRNLADYHVPTNADVPEINVSFVGEPDLAFSPIGARGMGEIGITGIVAAVANAVYHATGKRIRDLPITPDKLI